MDVGLNFDLEDLFIGTPESPMRIEYDLALKLGKLGKEVKSVRQLKKIGKEEIAILANVSLRQLEKLEEDGQKCSLSTLFKVTKALDIQLNLELDYSKDDLSFK